MATQAGIRAAGALLMARLPLSFERRLRFGIVAELHRAYGAQIAAADDARLAEAAEWAGETIAQLPAEEIRHRGARRVLPHLGRSDCPLCAGIDPGMRLHTPDGSNSGSAVSS